MTNTIPGLLNDTLSLVSLARETALVMGKEAQAKKLAPVVDELRTAVTNTQAAPPPSQPTGMMAQSDFRTLLDAAQKTPTADRSIPSISISERNMIAKAMADGNMPDVDIARQLGMTREEVQLAVNIGKSSRAYNEVAK